MVLKKSIYYGRFDGFQAPVVPKAPRSLRGSSHTKTSEGSKICAFELFSHTKTSEGSKICAFELLAAVAGKLLQESESSTSSTGPERKEQISVGKEFVNLEPTNLELKLEPPLKELQQSNNDSCLEHVSTVTSDFLKKVDTSVEFEASEGNKVGTNQEDLCDFSLVNKKNEDLTFRDPVGSCVNTHVLNKSCSSVNLPFYRGNLKTGIGNDDKKALMKAFKSQSHTGYRRIRKFLTSRYWKVALKKEYELTNTTSGGAKPFYHNRKDVYVQERRQIEAASKRRKLVNHNSSNAAYIKEASKDSHVKFSIKSFKVPELYLELPETATVGSLKRTVMEAITAFLGGELRVGILLEGKKVGDNNITLEQTGISQNCNLETLGFTLEPCFPDASPSLIQNEFPFMPPCDIDHQLSRSRSNPTNDVAFSTSLDNHVNKNQELIPFQTEESAQEQTSDSKALVQVQPVKAEALSMVPVSHRPDKKSLYSLRRIRRPFSVSEVEALVEAVETLGTGRWHDVKLRAFEDANHRTYVDLKDKWKTLVHTAGISPQQRRGEPVPQNLLDRVLSAHAHWTRHQCKEHKKHQNELLQISDGSNAKFFKI